MSRQRERLKRLARSVAHSVRQVVIDQHLFGFGAVEVIWKRQHDGTLAPIAIERVRPWSPGP